MSDTIEKLKAKVAVVPALLDLAEAVLDYERAQRIAARTRMRHAQTGLDSVLIEVANRDQDEARCRDNYLVAIAKLEDM